MNRDFKLKSLKNKTKQQCDEGNTGTMDRFHGEKVITIKCSADKPEYPSPKVLTMFSLS